MKESLRRTFSSRFWPSLPYVLSLVVILRSRPFLKLPYDMWHHLMLIRGWYQDGEPILTRPGTAYREVLWHWIWANIFKFINVSDVFVWAKVIHCLQFSWALFCVTYFTEVILKHWAKDLPPSRRRILALLGAWCFIMGAGTFSVQFQLPWILWYSVNYQGFTLPAYFLASGLLMNLVLTDKLAAMWPKTATLLLVFCSMVALHPLESGYFLIVLCVFPIFFAPEIIQKLRKSPVLVLVIVAPFFLAPFLLYILPLVGIPLPRPSGLDSAFDLKLLWQRVLTVGTHLQVNGLHRGFTTFNELAIMGCLLLALTASLEVWRQKTNKFSLSQRFRVLMFVLFLAVLFALLPRLTVTSGTLALLTVDEQVWRFSFASPWFVGFAIWGALFVSKNSSATRKILVTAAPIIFTFFISRFIVSGPFNTTASAVIRSLELIDRHSVGVQFDQPALKKLEDSVRSAPRAQPPRRNIFLVRSDLQTYVRAATGAYVVGDRLGAVDRTYYDNMPDKDQYDLIIIDPPSDIPVDQEMAKAFPSMGLPIK